MICAPYLFSILVTHVLNLLKQNWINICLNTKRLKYI